MLYNIKMEKIQNVKLVSSPQSSPFDSTSSVLLSRKPPLEPTKLFKDAVPRQEQRYTFADVALAKSGFYSPSIMQESTVRSPNRALGNLSEDRIRKIAKDFLNAYGNGTELISNGYIRIQREAYEKCSEKADINDATIKQLAKAMDQNRGGRVTEQDILSLCRRYLTLDKRPITYTPSVEERLAVARRLFKQFDVEKKGYLTEKQVPNLLNETYRALGKSFLATEDDVKSWMKIADGNNDGQVTLAEYESSIIRALKKQGIRIYQQ